MPAIPDLPEEIASLVQEHEVKAATRLEALGIALAAKRQEAINARKASGIEAVWLAAEEAYIGMDDSNRDRFAEARWCKPVSMTGPLTRVRGVDVEVKSDAFVRLTSRYVDAGAAKLSEILLAPDAKSFSFTATPVPELISAAKDTTQAVYNGIALERDARPEELQATPGATVSPQGGLPPAPSTGMPPAAPGVPLTLKDLAEEAIELAQERAKKAEKRIYDWMVQSRFRAEARKVIFDAARIGVGVFKGPFPRNQTSRAFDATTKSVKMVSRVVPGYEWVDPWLVYPHDGCGENIHDGDDLFVKDHLSAKKVKKLKKDPGYIPAAIDKVLKEGPNGSYSETQKPGEKPNKSRFPVWYFYGAIKCEDMVAAGGMKEDECDKDEVYAICTMVNDTVVKATINPLDSGEFPYHSVPWQRRAGHWAGIGVGEQLEMPQRGINATIRAMFNNAGKSAGSIIVIDRGSITPADGSWALTPDKIFYKAADATSDDVRKAFAFFQIPNMTPQLLSIFELCLRIAEEVTNIPLVTQGQSGPTSPETYGATQLQNNNANQLLRSIGYAFDDYITEPVVNQSYEYLLLDPEVPEDEKGDWHIDAHGSAALIERAIEDATIAQMSNFVLNPAFGVDPKRWFAEFSKTKHLNPKNFQYTDEEQAKIDSQPPPPPPAVQVAQIRSEDAKAALAAEAQADARDAELQQMLEQVRNEAKLQIAAMRKEVDELRVQKDIDRDAVYVQAETNRTQTEHDARMREIEVKRELAILEYANKRELSLNDVKKELAVTNAKLQVQRELSAAAEAIKPAAEPAGIAPKGQSFVK